MHSRCVLSRSGQPRVLLQLSPQVRCGGNRCRIKCVPPPLLHARSLASPLRSPSRPAAAIAHPHSQPACPHCLPVVRLRLAVPISQAFTLAAKRREQRLSCAESALGEMLTNMSVLLLAPAAVPQYSVVGVEGGQEAGSEGRWCCEHEAAHLGTTGRDAAGQAQQQRSHHHRRQPGSRCKHAAPSSSRNSAPPRLVCRRYVSLELRKGTCDSLLPSAAITSPSAARLLLMACKAEYQAAWGAGRAGRAGSV